MGFGRAAAPVFAAVLLTLAVSVQICVGQFAPDPCQTFLDCWPQYGIFSYCREGTCRVPDSFFNRGSG
ncbi:hypothetical protein RRG08_035122 [Elysia crispata]|uniref:Uncharacterized protein n=1 Tax=Elysia crispata TaxID=231223 RepID=A0AAE1A7L9_9GAST|nr:hypothetical protein RRG08_035122 [Elysia crispata]